MPTKKKRKPIKKRVAKKKTLRKSAPKRKLVKKSPAKKKTAKKSAPKKKVGALKLKENIIGMITHYFPKVRAAVIKLKSPLTVGDTIKIKGHTTDFKQVISSMQIDHVAVTTAKKGAEIGLLVNSRVRQHDRVLKV